MMNGLDLFSGIGGLSLALSEWVRPVAYCENDRYAQSVLISRMAERSLRRGPIWDDVRTLSHAELPPIDIVYGGFPCQDISVAGRGKGLDGERSGLFFEIVRLVAETQAPFVFLENVPAVRTRGLQEIIEAFTSLRYDCRWTILSASSVGAPHLRKRWFLLAHRHRHRDGREVESQLDREEQKSEGQFGRDVDGFYNPLPHTSRVESGQQSGRRSGTSWEGEAESRFDGQAESMADAERVRCSLRWESESGSEGQKPIAKAVGKSRDESDARWWAVEPNVGRVADGVQFRVDRLKALGNAVVPTQAKEAFKILMGLE